jgi:5-methylthioadenosine/S-adenosylhomocysteine deaminase
VTTYYSAEQVYTGGAFRPHITVRVDGDSITEISSTPPPSGAQVVDFGSAALVPGCVNTHTHSFQSLLRGKASGLPLEAWLAEIYGAAQSYGPEECYVGGLLCFSEMLLSGTTTVIDFFYLNGRGNQNIEAVVRAAEDVGIRLVAARAFLDAPWGGEAAQEVSPALIENRFRELLAVVKGHSRVSVIPAPHSIYGASRQLIELAHELAISEDTIWTMHLADSKVSADRVYADHGLRSVELLESWGIVDDRFLGVHAMWLSDKETSLLADRGAAISHNPASNMLLGEKIIDLPRLVEAGIRVGLGTDGAASNNGLNLFKDARVAVLAQCARAGNPSATRASDMLRTLTLSGAQISRLPVGDLLPGNKADFVVLDLQDVSLLPNAVLDSNIIMAMSDRAVAHVYCGGESVVHNGKLRKVDQGGLRAQLASLRR